MPVVSFELSRLEERRPSGFDFGDLEVEVALGQRASSRGHSPNQSMMIYISLADLVSGVCQLCASPKNTSYEFVGTGSSFVLRFRRMRTGTVQIVYRGGALGEVTPRDLLSALRGALTGFLERQNALPPEDPVAEDLGTARAELERTLRRVAAG